MLASKRNETAFENDFRDENKKNPVTQFVVIRQRFEDNFIRDSYYESNI